MHKKIRYGVFLAVFLALSLIPSVGMAIFGASEAGGNEKRAQMPELVSEDGKWNADYLSQLADWVDNSFFLRQELISADRWLSAHLFHTSGEDGVILGKDGWLFYSETIADYTSAQPLSQRQLFSAAKNLELMERYCQENGKQFLFVIAPNKNSLYPQFMPDLGVRAEVTDAERLLELLQHKNIPVVDLFAALRAQEEILYFSHDSHWNSKGAALGADLINRGFGVESDYYSGDFSETVSHSGDLYAMLYPAFDDPEQDLEYGADLNFTFESNATRPDAIVLRTASPAKGSLLAYRDSFGNLLFPYLADSYGSAKFSRSTAYDLTGNEDYVLIELVERNLKYLITNIPVMAAPAVEAELPLNVKGSIAAETARRGDLNQIRGKLFAPDDDTPVYVFSGTQAFEAFCMDDNGFALNLPGGVSAEAVVYRSGGSLVRYELTN